ncbi:acyltransferase family protein [Flavobacterium sp. XS2P39]|uniref:acyltransferase family protein n=1 Tax=Flavobacterium sp. XS2P39 TaxID=3401725 RepID=UPI003AAB958E
MNERRYDLDWLRVIAILLLHLFHCAMPFVAEEGWHIKNKELSSLMLECNYFISRWRMPLLFLISGIGTTFIMSSVSKTRYVIQRSKRLLLPLVIGMLLIVPPQIYFERLFQGIKYDSFLTFYPSIFSTGIYPKGNFFWHHLWFIAYLFVYSILALPFLLFIKSEKGKKVVSKLANITRKMGMYWCVIPLYLAFLLYFWYPNDTHALIGDWAMFTKYFTYFILGSFIGINQIFWNDIVEKRRQYLKIAFLSTILINYFRWNDLEPEWGFNLPNLMFIALGILNVWTWLLTIFGYGKKYLNFNNKILVYANEGIYPFYILHQTFIVIIGYYVIQVDESIINKYLFLTFVSFFLSIGVYDFFIKPYNHIRILFGMKKSKPNG